MAEGLRALPGFQVQGCPTAEGQSECTRGCGGFHRLSTDALTRKVIDDSVPVTLCGPLTERVEEARKELEPYQKLGPYLFGLLKCVGTSIANSVRRNYMIITNSP
jgi:hypothetical protein